MVQEERTRSSLKICRAIHVSYVESNSTRSPACLEQRLEERGETLTNKVRENKAGSNCGKDPAGLSKDRECPRKVAAMG